MAASRFPHRKTGRSLFLSCRDWSAHEFQLVVRGLQDGFSFLFSLCVGLWLVEYGFSGCIVEYGRSRTVHKHETVAECGIYKRISVVFREDVAAVYEVKVWQTELAEQGGGHVALVHERVYDLRLLYGSAYPEHGDVVECGGCDVECCRTSVVRQADYQQVLPYGQLFELVDELNARNIEVSAAEFATMVTDSDGYPMSSRKVGALLANAAKQGLISKSPEKWATSHYAPNGFQFTAKPKTVRAKKLADGTLVEA